MIETFNEVKGLKIDFVNCPYCGGTPEWVTVSGDDYVMRCSNCHASTPEARYSPEKAAKDWNAKNINDDNFTIIIDTPIDKFLEGGIKKIALSRPLAIEEYPLPKGEYLCGGAVIVTENIILSIEFSNYQGRIKFKNNCLKYEDISSYGEECFTKSLVEDGTDITFKKSTWRNNDLLSLEFCCGNKLITIFADINNDSMAVQEQPLPISEIS